MDSSHMGKEGALTQLQLQGYSFYVSHPETHREAGICQEWTDVGWNTVPFVTILRAGPDPEALENSNFYHPEQSTVF
jgi:hypothetical protein